ncbi:MAG TPA: arsenate reductase (azurin) small subunit [Gammaproteobacteria bacterium]|nr:arsenate reductase (azurin) small subunit [Gammaproteobacteria bacterium]
MMTRRRFLMTGSAAAISVSTISLSLFPGRTVQARVVEYPRKHIARLSALKDDQPLEFNYPDDGANSAAMLVKMGGVRGGGGIGPQGDVVAFSYICTHQGGPLQDRYRAVGNHRVLGQCPMHLSTFDLTRHGIVVSGQAYENLPQVLLELEGDEIYAVGIMGLLYGRNRNLMKSQEG